jgi:hypothetical protein
VRLGWIKPKVLLNNRKPTTNKSPPEILVKMFRYLVINFRKTGAWAMVREIIKNGIEIPRE